MSYERIKHVIIIVLALCLVISVGTVSTAAAGETTISGAVVTADPGAQVQMDITIANNPGVLGLTLAVSYPSELTLTGANAGSAFTGLSMTKPGIFQSPCNFSWDGLDDAPDGDGVVLTLLFTVSDAAQAGANLDVALRVISGSAVDGNLNPISVTTANGTIKVNGAVQPATYTVTVAPSSNGTASVDKPTAAANETVKVTVNPADGFELEKITFTPENGAATDITKARQFTMPAKNVTVNVSFKALPAPVDQVITASDVITTYGATNAKITARTSGNGALSYSVVSGDDVIAVGANGALTIKKAGTAQVKITAAATPSYNAAEKTVAVTVNPASVRKPAAGTATFTYNGNEQTYPVAANNAYTVSGNKQKNTGSYTVTVALKDKTNYQWEDGTTLDLSFPFEIGKAKITITAKNKSAVINSTAPVLGSGDYTVSGLKGADKLTKEPTIAYASTPDMTQAGSVAIKVSGAAAGDNYTIEYKDGTLTISTQSSGGGGGGGAVTSQFTLTYNTNGGSVVAATKHDSGAKVNLTAAPTKEGYTFTGWYADAALKNKITSVTMDADVTVYAGWALAHDCPSAHLKDVDQNAWYHEYVDYVIERGLMSGVSADQFGPDLATSRGMIVTILYNLEGRPAVSGASPFDDVKSGEWYADAVIWANGKGIVSGYGGGKFGPNDLITREQFAAILFGYAKSKGYNTKKTADLAGYTDTSSVSEWAVPAMKWANAEGLISGRTQTTLAPKGSATRAEAATILRQFIENVK